MTPGSGGNVPPDVDAGMELLKAENKAIEDFKKGLISADDAMAQFAEGLNTYGKRMTDAEQQADVDRVESVINKLARLMGKAGVGDGKEGAGGGTEEFDAKYGSEQINKKLEEALDAFQKGEATADETMKRMQKVLDRFGSLLDLTDEDEEAVRNQFEEAMGGGGSGGGGGGGKGTGGSGTDDEEDGDEGGGKKGKGKGWKNKSIMDLIKKYGGKTGGGVADLLGESGMGSKLGLDAAGSAAGLAEFAGPAAIVAIGAKIMTQFYSGVADTTKKLGDVSTSIAKNDGVGAITGVMDAWGEAYKKVPIVGEMLDAEIGMYSQFIKTFDQVTAAFEQRGRELAKYDGRIASADANSNVVKLLADIREAQELGAEYAELIAERTAAEVEFQKALTPIKKVLMQNLIPMLQFVNLNLKAITTVTEFVGKGVQDVYEVGDKILQAIAMTNPLVMWWLNDQKKKKTAAKDNDLLKKLFDLTDMDLTVEGENTPTHEPQPPLGINLFD